MVVTGSWGPCLIKFFRVDASCSEEDHPQFGVGFAFERIQGRTNSLREHGVLGNNGSPSQSLAYSVFEDHNYKLSLIV